MRMRRIGLRVLLCISVSILAVGTSLAGELFDKVYVNDMEGVKKLLAAGADINEESEVGGAGTVTPLFIASSYYEDMAKLLISKGAEVNTRTSKGQTPLMAACYLSEEVARLLIEKGADVTAKSNDGTGTFTYCFMGIMGGKTSTGLAELMLSKGANVDDAAPSGEIAGYTCLMMASRNGKPELVKFLVKNGANVNAKAKDGSTPLGLATKENDAEMVELLKSLGAE